MNNLELCTFDDNRVDIVGLCSMLSLCTIMTKLLQERDSVK